MRVTVELQAYLSEYSPSGQSSFELEVADGATVHSIVRSLKVPEEMASIIVVNDSAGDFDDTLGEGDRLTLIPPISGG